MKIFKLSILKTVWYSIKFRSKILVGKRCKIYLKKGSKIIVKNGVLRIGIEHNTLVHTILEINESGILNIDGNVSIGKGCKVVIANRAKLEINNDSYINECSKIVCLKNIHIGKKCAISWGVNILDTDYHYLIKKGVKNVKEKNIYIDNHVWIGCNSTILKGSFIGENTVISANSLVNSKIKKNGLFINGVFKEGYNWSK